MSKNEKSSGNDNVLFRRFLDGDDKEALTALVNLYGEELTRFISRITGNSHDAEELMIDAYVQLVRNKSKIKNPEALKSYLFTTGKNLALNFLKKNKRSPVIFENLDILLESADTDHAPDTELSRKEQKRQLDEAMQRLKKQHRDVLQLIYFENKSYVQAGGAMGKTVKQIDNLLCGAKAALKKALERESFVYETEQ
ncbi:MAG: sigma-70 family RNA polymerase sigma factor [Oscillospiraceae bacterium]|nr:sigma-70 family RNA polymerase sigma factor [Oscillospiraceae bacterium]